MATTPALTYEGVLTFLSEHRDIVESVLEYLDKHDLAALGAVSVWWWKLVSQERLWKRIAVREFGLAAKMWTPEGGFKALVCSSYPRVGDVMEVVDTVRNWVVARVIFVLSRYQFHIYYEGWTVKYNEWIDLRVDSFRIRPVSQFRCGLGRRGPLNESAFCDQIGFIRRALVPGTRPPFVTELTYLPSPNWLRHGQIRVDQPAGSWEDLMTLQSPRRNFQGCLEVNWTNSPLWIRKCQEIDPPSNHHWTFSSHPPAHLNTDYTIPDPHATDEFLIPKLLVWAAKNPSGN